MTNNTGNTPDNTVKIWKDKAQYNNKSSHDGVIKRKGKRTHTGPEYIQRGKD